MVLAVVLAACAGGGKGQAEGVLLIPPERLGKGCEPWRQPTPLPSSSELLRPGTLQQVSGQLRAGTLLLAMRFDQDGRIDRLAVIGGSASDSTRSPVERVVQQGVVPDKRYASGSFRVLLTGGDSVNATVGRSEYCPPVKLNSASGQSAVTVDLPADQVSSIRAARYNVLVNTSGRVVQTKLVQSSGNRSIDDQVARDFLNWRLRPALLDSTPVAAWMDVPQ